MTLAPPLMTNDMVEQPAVIQRLIEHRQILHERIARIAPPDLHGIALVGRGSSANAAMFGHTLLELTTGKPTVLVSPSIERLYRVRTDYRGYLAIGLSQSGETPEIISTLWTLRKHGAVTIGLSATVSAALASIPDLWIDIGAGTERAVPSTKSFTAELAALVIVSEALGNPIPDQAWSRMIAATAAALRDLRSIEALADRLETITHCSVIAAGMFLGIAEEIALKLQETALVAASAHSAASYKHGPQALAGRSHPVIAIIGPGAPGKETTNRVEELRALNVPVSVIGAGSDISIGGNLPEPLATIPAAVRGQQLALALATRKGLDADHPPKLTKVTVT